MPAFPFGWRSVTGVGVLGGIALIFVLDLLRPDHEILYSGSFITSACPEIQGKKQCAGVYQLSIANSGDKSQDEVRASWGIPLEKWVVKINVSDLVAGTKQKRDPTIESTPELAGTAYLVRGLEPNTVVEFKLTCAVCTLEELEALKNAPLKVTGKGTVTNSEPRWTIFGRALRNLERVVRLLL